MKNIKSILLVAMLAVTTSMTMTSCQMATPDGDEEAVLIKKPWIFGHGGVDSDPVAAGSSIIALTTNKVYFKITPVTYNEEFKNMITADNTPVHFVTSLKLQIKKGETPVLLKGFGEKWYENSVAPTLRMLIRDKVSAYPMFQLTTQREVLANVEQDIFNKLTAYCKGLNIPVTVLQVTIGAVVPPDEVLEETRKTAAQNQAKLTQDSRAKTELSRKQADINKAIADKAYREEMGMNTNEYLQLRGLEIEKEKIELVKENKNATIIMGQGIVPTIPIK